VTDAQGNYSVRGVFEPGDVAILVSEATGAPLATRIVRVDKSAVGSLKGLMVVIPLDPTIAAATSVVSAEAPPATSPRRRPRRPAAVDARGPASASRRRRAAGPRSEARAGAEAVSARRQGVVARVTAPLR
jgi:hypothetical protein